MNEQSQIQFSMNSCHELTQFYLDYLSTTMIEDTQQNLRFRDT